MSTIADDYLARILEPVTRSLTPNVATALINLRPDPTVQSRIDELATKANEGTLTLEEAAEYEDYIEASDLVGILQASARALLARTANT